MEEVNEKSVSVVTVLFKDEDSVLISPSAATYRIDDKTTGNAVVAVTSIVPIGGMYDIIITAAQNAIINTDKAYETKVVTVSYTYGTGSANAVYEYKVKNLLKVT